MYVVYNMLVEHSQSKSTIRRHHAMFEYGHVRAMYYLWSNLGSEPPHTIILLGAGQIGKIPKWVARAAGPGVIVAQGLPYWHAGSGELQLSKFTLGYWANVLHTALDLFKVPALNIIAESQATPGAIHTALDLSDKVRNVVLVLPMGLTTEALGTTPEERFKEFRRRSVGSVSQRNNSPFSDARNVYIWLLFAKLALRQRTETRKKYALGVSYNAIEPLRALAKLQAKHKRKLALILGAKDKLFSADEIMAALQHARLDHLQTVVMPQASHASLAVRGGRPTLAKALAVVQDGRA